MLDSPRQRAPDHRCNDVALTNEFVPKQTVSDTVNMPEFGEETNGGQPVTLSAPLLWKVHICM